MVLLLGSQPPPLELATDSADPLTPPPISMSANLRPLELTHINYLALPSPLESDYFTDLWQESRLKMAHEQVDVLAKEAIKLCQELVAEVSYT